MSVSVLLQHLLPLRLLTRVAGHLAQNRHPLVAQALIRSFMWRHGVTLHEAGRPMPADYPSFNDFFARKLRPGARPLAQSRWVSPADGTVSQLGWIGAGRMIQAKQRAYAVDELLADAELARHFEGGRFTTVYLSPCDYHRVHMPCAGRLLGMRHVPGTFFSVRPDIVRGIDSLLARNERLVCWFEHPQHGIFAMVLVGAAIVGSISTVWHGQVSQTGRGPIRQWAYRGGEPATDLAQGAEMGHFQLGSTVVVLMPQAALEFHPGWQEGQLVRQGQAMSHV